MNAELHSLTFLWLTTNLYSDSDETKTYQRPNYFMSQRIHKPLALGEVVELQSIWIDWWSISGHSFLKEIEGSMVKP